MLEKLLEGLAWGLWTAGILVPVMGLFVVWRWVGPKILPPAEEEAEVLEETFEEPPPMPEPNDEAQFQYRYPASTIVRPPKVISRTDPDENDDE